MISLVKKSSKGEKQRAGGDKREVISKKVHAKKSKKQVVHERGKRKEAIARVTISPGKGRIRINGRLLSSFSNPYFKEIVMEPLRLIGAEEQYDVKVSVSSGGLMGQAQAIRRAIAVAVLEYVDSEALRAAIKEYDRFMLVEDWRRVEPKKYKGRKARARFQKSYR